MSLESNSCFNVWEDCPPVGALFRVITLYCNELAAHFIQKITIYIGERRLISSHCSRLQRVTSSELTTHICFQLRGLKES